MAAGSEGYVDTRGSSTFLEDSIGTMISKALAAKVLADKERKFAKKKALEIGMDEAQFDAMNPPGFFFKKALIGEFGGFKLKKKKQELAALYRKALLVGKVTKNKKLRGRVVGQLKQSLIYSKANLKNAKRFRSQFDYNDWDDYLAPQSEKIPSTRKKVKNAIDGGGKRVSREQIIESIDAIAKSIERTAQAITQSSSSVYGTLITSNQLQADVAQDLKVRNTTLEDKLQKLVDVISNQTQVQKDIVDKREDIQQEAQLERKTVAAGAETPDDLRTQKNESRTYSSFANETEMMDAYLQQPPEVKPVSGMANDLPSMEANGFPKAEKGGSFSGKGGLELHGTEALIPSTGSAKIISGPDSGYLHEIDKPTTVVPLDNNYTQGEPSAVDGKVRPKPETSILSSNESSPSPIPAPEINTSSSTAINSKTSMVSSPKIESPKIQKFETGTQNNFNDTTFSNSININTDATQPLIDAANLLPMAVGGGTLAMTSEYINSMGDSGNEIRPLLYQNARILSNVFGLPSTIVSRASGSITTSTRKEEETIDKDEESKDVNKKSLFEKMKEGFAKFMELLGEKIQEGNGGGGDGGGGGGGGGAGGVNAGDVVADTAEEKAFIATVRELEGTSGAQGYNTFFGGSQYGGDLSTKSVTEVKQLQEKFLAEGKGNFSGGRSAAVGAGQFMYPEAIVKEMGLDPNKVKFTPELQNQMILHLARKRRGVDPSKPLTKADMDILQKEWASFGTYYGQTKRTTSQALDVYNQNLKEARAISSPSSSPTPTSPVAGNKPNPPGALAQNQRPDKSLTNEQWKVQQQALQEAKSMGLTGAAKDKYVAEKVMNVPSAVFQRPQQQQPSSIFDMSSAPKQNQPTIVALNTSAASKPATAGSAPPSNAETATVGRGSNPLKGSGLYIEIV